MKRWLIKSIILVLIFSMLTVGTGAAEVLRTGELTLADSLNLTKSYVVNNGTQEEHILVYQPGGDVKPMVVYGDTLYGRSNIEYMRNYMKDKGYTVVGGINAAFFDLKNGLPIGMVVKEGILRASGSGISVGIKKDGSMLMGDVTLEVRGLWEDADILLHYNQLLTENNGMVLYSGDYDTKTKGNVAGYHVLLQAEDEAALELGGEVECTVKKIAENTLSCSIPEGCFVLSLAEDFTYDPYQQAIRSLETGDTVTITAQIDKKWEDVEYAVGAGDLLVDGGQPVSAFSHTSASSKASRTAIGVTENGEVICYTVDECGVSSGITLPQLAQRMAELGCETAVNLDGGGSTVIGVTQPGETAFTIANEPSDGQPRPCANYIFFVRPTTAAQQASKIFVYPYDSAALPGGKITLKAKAADDHYMAASMPSDVVWTANGGSVSDGVFTAGSVGKAVVTATAGGHSGSAVVQVVQTPTHMTVVREEWEKPVEELLMETGMQIDLTAFAEYQGLELAATDRSFTWNVPEELGSITEDGLLTVGQQEMSGVLTVSCGDLSVEIPLETRVNPMTDLEGHWAREFISQLYFRDVLKGSENTEGELVYRPDASMTRQEFVVALMRWLDVDVDKYAGSELPFADGSQIASWASNAMKAAYALEYFTGSKENGKVYAQPNSTITREAAMTILARTQAAVSDSDALDEFEDEKQVSDWARESLTAMVEQGVINGIGGKLQPQGNVTRSQVAKMLFMMS